MRRQVWLGLVLAFLFSVILIPGCAQHPSTASPGEGNHVLAGGASNSGLQQEELTGQLGETSQESPVQEPAAEPEGPAEPEAPEFSELPVQNQVQEYGQSASYLSLDSPVAIQANYPSGDIPALEQAVLDWVNQTAAAYQEELGEGERGSFRADYSSYEVNGRVVSVTVNGVLGGSHANRPRNVFAVFNADRSTGAVLALSDVLAEGGVDTLRGLAAERAGTGEGADSLLSCWRLTGEGLRLYLDEPGQQFIDFTYLELLGILWPPLPERTIDPEKPMIALTFDDGPSNNTPHILDLFATFGGKGTFFVVGSRVSTYADAIGRTAAEGHEVGIHTWNHTNLTKVSNDQIKAEIMDTQNAVQQYAGFTCAAVRPPGGAANDTVKAVAGELGFYLANWSIDTEDWKTRDADATYEAIMSQACDGAIVLCHDLYESTAAAMERVIPELIAQGYQLVTVSELLSYSEGGAQPGHLYRYR